LKEGRNDVKKERKDLEDAKIEEGIKELKEKGGRVKERLKELRNQKRKEGRMEKRKEKRMKEEIMIERRKE